MWRRRLTLTQQDVANSRVDAVADDLTALQHVTILELHALGTLSTQLARDDDLATLGVVLHNVAEDTIASPESHTHASVRVA